jgi:hypothetical protein
VRGLSAEVSVLYDSDECDEKDKAEVGGDSGGSEIAVGSAVGPKVGLL